MSEERAPYYTSNQEQPKPAETQSWQLIMFRDGSTLEIMSKAVHEDALAVEWAKVTERWLNEQLNQSDLLAE